MQYALSNVLGVGYFKRFQGVSNGSQGHFADATSEYSKTCLTCTLFCISSVVISYPQLGGGEGKGEGRGGGEGGRDVARLGQKQAIPASELVGLLKIPSKWGRYNIEYFEAKTCKFSHLL